MNRKSLVVVAAGILVIGGVAAGGGVYYTGTPEFCGGSCHAMTEAYDAWKISKHHAGNNSESRQASCVECHFLPGEKMSWRGQMRGLRHLAAYLYDPNMQLPIRAVVEDGSCLRSGCHARDTIADKEIQYTQKVTFKHKAHFGDKALAGQKLSCDTCHMKVSQEKHFEVPGEICFVCHFTPRGSSQPKTGAGLLKVGAARAVEYNKGAAKCDLCHTIPDKPLQKQKVEGGDSQNGKVITHQTLKDDGVPCESCHYDSIHGSGEVNLGNVIAEGCLTCHNARKETLDTARDGKLMHDKHIPTARADCFDCHRRISHQARPDHYDRARYNCTACHDREQHREQQMLVAGAGVVEGVEGTPGLMDSVNTNCMGCHLQDKDLKGHTVKTGSAQSCADCHTKDQKDMVKDWQDFIRDEVKGVEDIRDEARLALDAVEGKAASGEKLAKAKELFQEGQRILNVVARGNGVHNKKYSVQLLDEAFTRFEDLVDLLETQG